MFNQKLYYKINIFKKRMITFIIFFKYLLTSLFLVFLLYNAFYPFECIHKPSNIIGQDSVSSIKKIDSIRILNTDAEAHNKVLINVLQERLAIDNSEIASSANVKTQFRLFYTAILAGLSSLLFRKNNIAKKGIRIVLLSLIIIMYLLEVHFDDLHKRQREVNSIKIGSIDSLANLKLNDSTWYDLCKWDTSDVNSIAAKWKEASKPEITRKRKLNASLSLDLEQIVYYWIPWVALYYYPCFQSIKKRRYKRQ